jgi:hypothetical protein
MAKISASLFRGYHSRRVNLVPEFAPRVLEYLGTALSLEVRDDLLSGRIDRVVDREIDPRSYHSAAEFSRDYLAVSLLSKYPFKEYRDKAQREKIALEKFLRTEESCAVAELCLKHQETVLPSGVTAASYLHVMQRKISNVLGTFSWDKALPYTGFGPGATTRLSRRKADAYYKLGGIPHVTQRCGDLAMCLVSQYPIWEESIRRQTMSPLSAHSFEFVKGNRITTVPKNAKTERIIAIEPDMNLFLQKGIGGLIRKQLAVRADIDLNSQVGNQVLARLGSEQGRLATIDLASASDTVSWALCRDLLPPDWLAAIEHCRSPKGTLPDGTQVLYRKVSSMGNGFTFELESLLFWAAIQAVYDLHPEGCLGRPHRVYGDDIVILTSHADHLINLLAFIGFETNAKKTYSTGPFRESCGKHYFRGVDVTPFYIREDIDTVPRRFWFHNQLVRWFIRQEGSAPAYLGDAEQRLLDDIVSTLPTKFHKYRIPYGEPGSASDFGEVGLLGTFDESCPKQLWFGSYEARGLTTSPKYARPTDDGFLLRQLYSCFKMGDPGWEIWGGGIVSSEKVREVKLTVFQWSDPYVRL